MSFLIRQTSLVPVTVALIWTWHGAGHVMAQQGAEVVSFYGYDDCIRLTNSSVTVTLCPAAGGRVLEYSRAGTNVLYLPPGEEGWQDAPGATRAAMNAGRFDIGPEKVVRRGKVLWQGRWSGEVIGDRAARLTSQFDPVSGVRLVRDFQLHHSSSQLRCSQTMINESNRPVSLCYWSRTFAVGGGVAVIPRSPRGRFPVGYTMSPSGNELQIFPDDPNIQVSDEAVIVTAAPEHPKLGFDSHTGWLAYLAPTNQMFVKRYQTFPNRAYNEFAGLTLSVWYPQSKMVELEPIGPAENLDPGQRASYTEEWWLLPREFPEDVKAVEFADIQRQVRQQTQSVLSQPEPPMSPLVHDDRRVTFRLVGKTADQVQVNVLGERLDMHADDDGLWQITTEPLPDGIHEYTFSVDGVRVTDPRNRWVKKWKQCASLLEIPANPPRLTELQSVAHGTLHRHIYASQATGTERAAIVYTPPGFDADATPAYPLLVLCHGNGDDETAWTEVGRAHNILDNLIAANKIQPMVVVMPNGHPIPLADHSWSEDYRQRNRVAMIEDVVGDLLPMVQSHYNVSRQASQRAITGLSMGGGQSIAIAMSHPQLFDWAGAFSAAAPQGDLQSEHPGLQLNAEANAKRRLFWIACGKDDFLVERNRNFSDQLKQLGIGHQYVETAGSHNWGVWRDYLPQFLKLIFVE